MIINKSAVFTPRKGDTLIIRGEMMLDGRSRTSQWAFRLNQQGMWLPRGEYGIQLTGNIIGASLPEGVDDRIAQQRKSIDIMLDHLKAHCPKLLGTGECEHIAPAVPNLKGDIL